MVSATVEHSESLGGKEMLWMIRAMEENDYLLLLMARKTGVQGLAKLLNGYSCILFSEPQKTNTERMQVFQKAEEMWLLFEL
jgi:predicted nuclease of restriction endonuclease-like RecB superfamily